MKLATILADGLLVLAIRVDQRQVTGTIEEEFVRPLGKRLRRGCRLELWERDSLHGPPWCVVCRDSCGSEERPRQNRHAAEAHSNGNGFEFLCEHDSKHSVEEVGHGGRDECGVQCRLGAARQRTRHAGRAELGKPGQQAGRREHDSPRTQSSRESLAGRREPTGECPFRNPEIAGRIRAAPTLQLAQHDRRSKVLRQPCDLRVQRGDQILRARRIRRNGCLVPHARPFVLSTAVVHGASPQSRAMGHAVQPTGNRGTGVNRRSLGCQHEEHRLEDGLLPDDGGPSPVDRRRTPMPRAGERVRRTPRHRDSR